MSTSIFSAPEEIQGLLGERVRRLRLNRNQDQAQVAAKAGVSERALRSLEAGEGSKLITLIRVLKALEALGSLDALAPEPSVSPMAMLGRGKVPQRASRPRRAAKSEANR
jgi:transcriptional regulator with XRE-family HTH domain